MTTLNEQELQDVTQGTTGPKDAEFNEVTAKRFIGSLTGNATTATQLQNNFSVVFNGDVEGRLSDCNGAGGYVVNIKVNESNHAKSAEFTAKTNYSDHAHFADLANLATHSLTTDTAHNAEHANESDETLHSVESDHALQSDKSLQADNANNAKESEHSLNSDNSLHAVQADTDNKERNIADTFDAILYTDLPAIRTNIANITPTEHTVEFKDKEYKLKNTLLAEEDNENKLLQDFSNSIEDVDNRITNLETTTDLGKVTERIVKIEELNNQQNARLDSIDTLNTEQNTRLDNVETLANNTANTVTSNKNTVDEQINNLQLQDDALSSRITNLDTTHKQDIDRLDNSDTSLQEQITLQAQNFNSHKEDETAHSNLIHYTDSNAHSELFAQYVKKSGDTMNGRLTFSFNDALYRDVDNSYLHLCGGNVFGKSASLILNGGQNLDGSSSYGGFELSATNGEDMTNLVGQSTGSLTWGGKNLVRSVNGVNADTQGNVTIDVAAGNTVSLKGTRTSFGEWTITELTPYKPLFIIYNVTGTSIDMHVYLAHVKNCVGLTYSYLLLDYNQPYFTFIPTSSSITISVNKANSADLNYGIINSTNWLKAYQ